MVETKTKPTHADRFASVKVLRADYEQALEGGKKLSPVRITFLDFFGAMLRVWNTTPERRRVEALREAATSNAAA